jgi:hypothetical protein
MDRTPEDDGIDTSNQSQRGYPQANDVAEDAMHLENDPSEDSEKVESGDTSVVPQDEQDLVDHMNQMVNSGQIDNSAFDGERNDNDEEDSLD